jgi:hypothetical protein
VKGILADANVVGQVEQLVKRMQEDEWADYWQSLGLRLRRFEDLGLEAASGDLEVWQKCQAEELILITDNRNDDSSHSVSAVIRQYGTPNSLPIFTIADLGRFMNSPDYAEQVVISFYDYLLRIETVLGTGRLYLP